jgi:hypothetical protein
MLLPSNISFEPHCGFAPKILAVLCHGGSQIVVIQVNHPLRLAFGDLPNFGGTGSDWLPAFVAAEYACRHG